MVSFVQVILLCSLGSELNNCTPGHGECEGRTADCVCQDGYTGLDCQLDDISCPNGQLNATGQCCQSGVFDTSGRCCGDNDSESTWRLDQQGQCCNQELNGCGECGGVGYLDARGNCCSVRQLCCTGKNSKVVFEGHAGCRRSLLPKCPSG